MTINGQVYLIPNMYKLLYQLFDGSGKGFFCEHDIFQIIWSINHGKQGVGPNLPSMYGADMIQGLEVKSKGCNYQIDRSSYADYEFTQFSTHYKDSFPRIKRSVFIEAFQTDLNALNTELERLRQLHLQKQHELAANPQDTSMSASETSGFKTRKKLSHPGKRVSQSSDFTKEDAG